jgi:hypothetical protein
VGGRIPRPRAAPTRACRPRWRLRSSAATRRARRRPSSPAAGSTPSATSTARTIAR